MTDTASPPASLMRAARRLNPAIDLDVDVVAVTRAAIVSTREEWSGATLAGVSVDEKGAIRLAESGAVELFSSGGVASGLDHYQFYSQANSRITETMWLDFWPDPAAVGPFGFTLHTLQLVLGRKTGSALFGFSPFGYASSRISNPNFVIRFARLDENWNREVIGEPLLIPANTVTEGATLSLDLRAGGRLIHVDTGRMRTRTGSGRFPNGSERTADPTFSGDRKVSHLDVPLGFSIGITVDGAARAGAWLGVIPAAAQAPFDRSAFWRADASGEHGCGPYSPDADGASPLDMGRNPGYGVMSVGAVPGYGAVATATIAPSGRASGQWGQAREVDRKDKPDTAETPGRNRVWHRVSAVAHVHSGTVTRVLDLGATPTGEVHFRADAAQPTGTRVLYHVAASADGVTFGAEMDVVDGQILGGAMLARWYRVRVDLEATPDNLTSPVLQAIAITERARFGTYRYAKDVDATVSIDPVTGQSEIGELSLPLLKLGRDDARDLVTRIATEYAPSNVEAWVYARETITGTRHFLNLYRLENREPSLGEEKLTFVSGMDRLKVTIPAKVEGPTYPAGDTAGTIAGVSYNSGTRELTLSVSGTPFAALNIVGWRYEGRTGALADTHWLITASPAPTANAFTIVLDDSVRVPAVGDAFKLHSDQSTRVPVKYDGQDFTDVYRDLLANQAAVPQRYLGYVPEPTGRHARGGLTAEGRTALEPLQEVALHMGGGMVWRRGRIDYVPLYDTKNPVAVWSERDYTEIQTTVGAARRMPSVGVKYDYDVVQGKFVREATFDDMNALIGWGRANLYDVANLPDSLCKWNDAAEAKHLAAKMLRAWSTGVRVWKVKMAHPWPWVELGDAVTVSTDVYTDRRLDFSSDGLNDRGEPVRGRTSTLGVVIGRNLWGTEFSVAVFGLENVTSAESTTEIEHEDLTPLDCPVITVSSRGKGKPKRVIEPALTVSFTVPDSPYFDHLELDVEGDDGSVYTEPYITASPVVLDVVCDDVTYTVTPRVVTTAGVVTTGTPVTRYIPPIRVLGRDLQRTDPGDGSFAGYDLRAVDTAGRSAESGVRDSRGSVLNSHFRLNTDTAAGVVETAGQKFIDGSAVDAARRVVSIYSAADGNVVSGSQTYDGVSRAANGFRDRLAGLVATANDSRGAVLNAHFRANTDSLASVLDGGGFARVNAGDMAGNRVALTVVQDTRATNAPPSSYVMGTVEEFKSVAAIGAPSVDTYGGLTTTKIWTDSSGGYATQHFRAGDGVWKREGGNSAASWGPWRAVVEVGTQRLDRTTGHAKTDMADSRGAVLNGMFRYGTDGTAGVVEAVDRRFVSDVQQVGAGRAYGTIDASNRVRRANGFDDGNYAVAAVNAAGTTVHQNVTDSRAAVLNNHFRYATDGTAGVVEATNRRFVSDAQQTGAGRAFTGLDASGRLTTGINAGATLLGTRLKADALVNLSGAQCNGNPDLANGASGYGVYDNNGTGIISIVLETDATAPSGSGRRLRIGGTYPATGTRPTPGLGGMSVFLGPDAGTHAAHTYHRGAELIHDLQVLIPAGWTLTFASNSTGDGSTTEYLTSMVGTGAWQRMAMWHRIGTTGTFSSTGFWYVQDGVGNTYAGGLAWYVAKYDIIDITQSPTIFTGAGLKSAAGTALADVDVVTAHGGARDSRGAPLNGMFRYGTDGAAGIIESAAQRFMHGDYLDASRRPVALLAPSYGVISGDAQAVNNGKTNGAIADGAGRLTSAANDSRGAVLNAHFRYGIDGTSGVLELGDRRFVTDAQQAGAVRAYAFLTAAGVSDTARIAGVAAASIARQAGRLFAETWEVPAANGWEGVASDYYFDSYPNGGIQGRLCARFTDFQWMVSRSRIPINPNKLYKLVFRARQASAGTSYSPATYVGFAAYRGDGSPANGNSGYCYVLVAGAVLGGGWTEYVAWMRGATTPYSANGASGSTDPRSPGSFNVDTAYITPSIGANYPAYGGYPAGAQLDVDYFIIHEYDEDAAARIYGIAEGPSTLRPTTRQNDGVTARVLAKGRSAGTARHGAYVSFPDNYQGPPMVLLRGGQTTEPRAKWGPTGSGAEGAAYNAALPIYEDLQPLNLDAAGFTLRARLRQKSGATPRSYAFPAGTLDWEGQASQVNIAAAPANDDTYTTTFSTSITASAPVLGDFGSVDVTIAVDTWDGAAWTERAVRSHYLSSSRLTRTVTYNDSVPVTVSGLNGGAYVRIRIKSVVYDTSGDGDAWMSVTPGSVTFNTSADNFATKTPDADDRISWEAISVS